MKRLLLFCSLIGIVRAHAFAAASLVTETPIKDYGTPVTISISSSTLTMVPSSQVSGRIGVFIDNPATNTGRIVGFFGNCTSTALASTIRPIEISPGNNTSYFPIREDVCLWLITTNTAAAENAHYQEVKQ